VSLIVAVVVAAAVVIMAIAGEHGPARHLPGGDGRSPAVESSV
jgi:hypothetical protein